ncbi:MAG TPA: YihY/virulence factor BrkB family protein [Candidatus Saccharimonadales bacterium]|jgi:membrane protein
MKYLKSLIVVLAGLFLVGVRRSVVRLKSGASPGQDVSLEHGKSGTGGQGRSLQTSDDPEEDADSPADLSSKGWKVALKRTKNALKDKQLSTQAAGMAYYATLTFFPALLGAATIFATFAGPETLLSVIDGLKNIVPPTIYDVIDQQLRPLANAKQGSLGIAALVSVAALLWTTSGGIQHLVKATNVAYEVKETRGLVKRRLTSIALSGVLLALGAAIVVTLILQGSALESLGAPGFIADIFPVVRWPLLIILLSIVLSVIYRYAPNRDAPGWSWVSWGATAATVIWLAGTILFFYYTQNFGNFNKSYGVFAGIIVMMIWFNLTSLIVLIGAQVNKKLEEVTDAETVSNE